MFRRLPSIRFNPAVTTIYGLGVIALTTALLAAPTPPKATEAAHPAPLTHLIQDTPTPRPTPSTVTVPTPTPPPATPHHTAVQAPTQAPARTRAMPAAPRTARYTSGSSAKDYARALLSPTQFACLDSIFERESGWNPRARNPEGAYGIPQANPGYKMSAAGSDWRTNGATQVNWGLSYIRARYGSPCAAWEFWQRHSWY